MQFNPWELLKVCSPEQLGKHQGHCEIMDLFKKIMDASTDYDT